MAEYPIKKFKEWLSTSGESANYARREFEEMRAAFAGEFLNNIIPAFQAEAERLSVCLVKLDSAGKLDDIGPAGKEFRDLAGRKKSEIAARRSALAKSLADDEKKLIDAKAMHDMLIEDLLKENKNSNAIEEKQKLVVSRREGAVAVQKKMLRDISGGIGRLINFFTIRNIKIKLAEEIELLIQEKNKLNDIRREYVAEKLKNFNDENELAKDYDELFKKIAAARNELARLSGDEELTARIEAARQIFETGPESTLNSMKQAFEGIDLFIRMRARFNLYDRSLKMVTEEVGFIKSICGGLERLAKTVDSLEEQSVKFANFLSPLSFSIPDECAAFPAELKSFGAAVENEKALKKSPAEFLEVVKPFHGSHFNESKVKHFFESIGRAIQSATASWRSK